MSSFLIASIPMHGHVAPLLPVARHLVERGDTVRFLTGARFAADVVATGARHVPLPPEADYDESDLTTRFPQRATLSPLQAVAHDLEHVFVRPSLSQYGTIVRLLELEPADAIVVDPTFASGSLLVATPPEHRPPVAVACMIPLACPDPLIAPFGMGLRPLGGPLGRARNALLHAFAERVIYRSSGQANAEIHRAVRGIQDDTSVMTWNLDADRLLQFTVPSFEYPREAALPNREFVGPIAVSGTEQYPLPEWMDALSADRPTVLVTQGTLANDDLNDLIIPALQGLTGQGWQILVATGGIPVAELGELPADVYPAQFLPLDEVMPRVDVLVTNGGYGGTHFALRHGVPVIVAPGHEDKPEVAARVQWSGVGIRMRSGAPSPRQVRRGVRRVLRDPRYRSAVAPIACEIAASPGVAGIAAALDRMIAEHPPRR